MTEPRKPIMAKIRMPGVTPPMIAAKPLPPVERPVLVTTANRGVFFGYATDTTGETIFLRNAQLCVYWSSDMKGFMGLASKGPSPSCRIGEPADITLYNITAVVEVTAEAAERWKEMPWTR